MGRSSWHLVSELRTGGKGDKPLWGSLSPSQLLLHTGSGLQALTQPTQWGHLTPSPWSRVATCRPQEEPGLLDLGATLSSNALIIWGGN